MEDESAEAFWAQASPSKGSFRCYAGERQVLGMFSSAAMRRLVSACRRSKKKNLFGTLILEKNSSEILDKLDLQDKSINKDNIYDFLNSILRKGEETNKIRESVNKNIGQALLVI